jgi:hypothetical protein
MNADKSFVFNPRLSVFIGGHRFGRSFSSSSKCVRHARFDLFLRNDWLMNGVPVLPLAGLNSHC